MNEGAILPYLEKLIFNVYLIGYKNQGESIIFTLENDFGIAYSGVVDCFEVQNENETIKLLDKLGIKNLDIVCWTHPHEDHSIGIEKVLSNYVSEKTRIVFPNGLNQLEYSYSDKRIEEAIAIINEILVSPKIKKPKIRPVCDVKNIDKRRVGNQVQGSYQLEVTSFTPISDIIEKRELLDKLYTFNDYSVALLISIGGYNFLLSGDIQDTSIDKIEEFAIPEKIDYIKIPHHSSEHSLKLKSWLNVENKTSVSCTTEYASSSLPRIPVLDTYNFFSNKVFCTNKKDCTDGFGMIHTIYNVLTKELDTELYGSAYLY